ncbi:hypothetical protein KOW79_022766 [Hemibagrus wyckioides]|uniref:Ubiquitin-like domain-containing protein n=1 Tax=Hemibagrus wyckioides TaxID=337641 RepID=A0A9D3S8I3_9TELE|nr:hypothetical protein KOW79_022766 [Hemibagrus wyckioides]
MSTDVCLHECQGSIFQCEQLEEPVLCLQDEVHAPFRHTTHSVLQVVCDDAPGFPQPENVDLRVFDGSNGSSIPFTLKSTDTTDTLIKQYLQMKPELTGNLHLAYNGKRVSKHKSLRELGVKPGAMFITYQKCTGG